MQAPITIDGSFSQHFLSSTLPCSGAVVSDDSSADSDQEMPTASTKGGVPCQFPRKLHEMLDYVVVQGLEHVVSWQPHGRAFRVHKPKEFAKFVMPLFFGQTKYASFQRQLNLYGYSRFTHGTDKGAYYHACMIRGNPQAVRGMVRRKIKGTSSRRWVSPDEEPDFYRLPFADHAEVNLKDTKISLQDEVTTNHQSFQSISLTPSTWDLDDLEPTPIPSSWVNVCDTVARPSIVDICLNIEPTPLTLLDESGLDELFDDLPTFL